MDSMLTVLAKVDCIIVVLNDSPENILSRITFYDADSRPIARTLTQKERMHYLREIEKDADYFGRSFHRADMNIDIRGLSVDQAAKKIQNSLQSLPRKN
jgi:shikimate kinase